MKSGSNPTDRVPADFRIESSVLVILNRDGQPLWRYETGLANLMPENIYRKYRESETRAYGSNVNDFVIYQDLQGDGRKEVLFATQTQNELREGDLICFNDRGDRLWDFHAGHEARYGTRSYAADFRIGCLAAIDLDGDKKTEIILVSHHNPEWPCQIALLDCDGKLLGEYWNTGYINDFVFLDLDADGRKELVAGGMNNEYRKACFVALDTPSFYGASPNLREFRSADFSTGDEIAYILLPRTDIDKMEDLYETVQGVRLLANGNIQVYTQVSCLFFFFRPDLSLLQIMDSHAFQRLHRKYFEAVKVETPYTEEEYIKPLEKQVLYFDGQGWTTTPTTKLKATGSSANGHPKRAGRN